MKNIVFMMVAVFVLTAVSIIAAPKSKPAPVVLSTVTVTLQGVKSADTAVSLQKALSGIGGVSVVSVKSNTVSAKIDEIKLPVSLFVQAINGHLAKIQKDGKAYSALTVFIDADMCKAEKNMCAGCFTEIPKVLKKLNGIGTVKLDDTGKVATLTFVKDAKVTTKAIKEALLKSSYGFIVTFSK